MDFAYKKAKPLPGQLENCDICNKRFTVTPYSKTGPDGGLLCLQCGKELAKDEGGKLEKKAKSAAQGRKRRKVESDRLDHRVNLGAKTLQQMCIEKVAVHYEDLEEFGDLPQGVMVRLSEIFTKRRVLDPKTLKLFLRSDLDEIVIHDCANLEAEDYTTIFSIMHNTSRVVLKNACQFKDPSLAYIAAKTTQLEHLKLYAANLVSDTAWRSFFLAHGQTLKSIELDWLDASFDNDTVASLVTSCPNLERLKLRRCRKLTANALEHISKSTKLRHLSLELSLEVPSSTLVALVESLGANLQTLSLSNFAGTDADGLNGCSDDLLSSIHTHCRKLEKLRLSGTDACSDAAFAALFTDWANTELKVVDLSTTRDVDNSNPNGPEEAMGLATQGFAALMQHSGPKIEKLNI
ncbi:hypothetical protein LTS18_014669, partial [Coniosporium uncinatum]